MYSATVNDVSCIDVSCNLDDILIQIRNIDDFWIPFASFLVSQSVILHFWPSKRYYRSGFVVSELMAGSGEQDELFFIFGHPSSTANNLSCSQDPITNS